MGERVAIGAVASAAGLTNAATAEFLRTDPDVFRAFLPFEIPPMLGRGFDHLSYKMAQWVGLQVTGGSSSVRRDRRHSFTTGPTVMSNAPSVFSESFLARPRIANRSLSLAMADFFLDSSTSTDCRFDHHEP